MPCPRCHRPAAHREAIGFFRLALEEMPRRAGAGEPAERAAETIDLLFELRTSLVPLGEFTETLQHLQRAAELAESAGDRRRLGWVSAYLTQTHYTLGDQPAAIAAAERAIDLAAQLDDSALRLVALTGLGQAHQSLGRYREACDPWGAPSPCSTGIRPASALAWLASWAWWRAAGS